MHDRALRAFSAVSLVLLAPILFLQGRWVRRVTPRLPPADGPHEGRTAPGLLPLRLLVVGESTAVGVGVSRHDDGLAGQTARALAETTGRPVAWRVLGRSGASARKLVTEFIDPAPPIEADVVVVALGVNDIISLSSSRHWIAALESLLQAIRRSSPGAAVVVSGVPPIQHFPALPWPLRAVLGLRATILDRAAIRLVGANHTIAHLPHPRVPRAQVAGVFCADGFHPSARGYQQWGTALAAAASDILRRPARR
jgi:lysophospholipase L1-like esterase